MMPTLRDLLSASREDLRALMRAGHPIARGSLDDTEYRGTSLGLPAWLERLTWKTFRKTFYRDPEAGVLRGWNVRLAQLGVDGPSEPLLRDGAPVTFGHYVVLESLPDEWLPCAGAVLLHYGKGGNRPLDPVRLVRDPLVALRAGSADLLLGSTFLEAGKLRLPTPSYFALVREGRLTSLHRPPA